jgi:hypothetical protein
MSETEAVKETRRWRREVYEQIRGLTAPQRRAREEELVRDVRGAGVEFEHVIETDTEAPHAQTPPARADSIGESSCP